jgi:hypothetical protein
MGKISGNICINCDEKIYAPQPMLETYNFIEWWNDRENKVKPLSVKPYEW